MGAGLGLVLRCAAPPGRARLRGALWGELPAKAAGRERRTLALALQVVVADAIDSAVGVLDALLAFAVDAER